MARTYVRIKLGHDGTGIPRPIVPPPDVPSAQADGQASRGKLPSYPPHPQPRCARPGTPKYGAPAFRSGMEIDATTKVNPRGVGGCAALTFVVPDLVRTPLAGDDGMNNDFPPRFPWDHDRPTVDGARQEAATPPSPRPRVPHHTRVAPSEWSRFTRRQAGVGSPHLIGTEAPIRRPKPSGSPRKLRLFRRLAGTLHHQ